MAIRTLIATALMASACAAHADVISGSNVAAADSEVLVHALYQKVSASVGSDMKVSLKQGTDGVYVKGLSAAKAAALAGDGMSVIATPDGYKIVEISGGANTSIGSGAPGGTPNATPADAPSGLDGLPGNGTIPVDTGINVGIGNGSGEQAAEVPEPSSIALMLAGMLGVAGLGRRRAR